MAKKEFKPGETFQCGLVPLKCVESNTLVGLCDKCFFKRRCINEIVGHCSEFYRSDGKTVYFVKLEK